MPTSLGEESNLGRFGVDVCVGRSASIAEKGAIGEEIRVVSGSGRGVLVGRR